MFPMGTLLYLTLLCLIGSLAFVRSQTESQTPEEVSVDVNARRIGVYTPVTWIFSCQSTINPTEWVYNNDLTNISAPRLPCAVKDWTERWRPVEGFLNKSIVELQCDTWQFDLTFGCRSVNNHSDNVMIKLEVNQATGRLHNITKHRGEWTEYAEPEHNISNSCVRFTVAQTREGNYWKCDGPNGKRGQVNISYCTSSSSCANSHRKLKLAPVHIEYYVPNRTDSTNLIDQGWHKMEREGVAMYPAGIAVCTLEDEKFRGAAVEYFFAGRDKSTFHFTLSAISMSDFIWFDPPPASKTFYTLDQFKTQCKVSAYGFAVYPRVTATLNGSQKAEAGLFQYAYKDSTWTHDIIMDSRNDSFGPGAYEIECSAPVWNTSEWVSRTFSFEVRAVVPPYFDAHNAIVMVNEGDANVRLQCDVRGDPEPNVTWSHGNIPGVLLLGRDLVFTTVSTEWMNGSTINCYAANKYGQWVTKAFKLNVTEFHRDGLNFTWIVISVLALAIIITLGLCVGYLFARFVRFMRPAVQALSEADVKDFRQGRPASGTSQGVDGQLVIKCLPYNSEYEVAKENFFVELGSGQYGVVYKGHIKHGPDVQPTQVAVKTVRPKVSNEYFKALLSELKILAYIGEHENIAGLVGAYSSNIKHRELYVGIELCKTSLEKHLRNHASRFTAKHAETTFSQVRDECGNVEGQIATPDLIRWSAEIAAGMEYLTEKRVVHADLAARNVLLSFELRAKICDFGLARQMVNYAYIKKTKCYLPWKWMAIESLRQMHFSTMSDVWAYGVTCWEIFSLGAVPYPCEEWGWEFVDKLEAGNRLKRPKHASQEIFSILQQCWSERKERRPLFSELSRFFQEQGQHFANSALRSEYVTPDVFIS